MYVIEEINISDFKEVNYSLYIAVESNLERKIVAMAPRQTNAHIVFVQPDWIALRIGEPLKSFVSVASDYAIYESKSENTGYIISTNGYISTILLTTEISDVMAQIAALLDYFNVEEPLILLNIHHKTTICFILQPTMPRYICFKALPRKKWRDVEQVEVDYFWEILSHVLASDGKTAFEVKMKV